MVEFANAIPVVMDDIGLIVKHIQQVLGTDQRAEKHVAADQPLVQNAPDLVSLPFSHPLFSGLNFYRDQLSRS